MAEQNCTQTKCHIIIIFFPCYYNNHTTADAVVFIIWFVYSFMFLAQQFSNENFIESSVDKFGVYTIHSRHPKILQMGKKSHFIQKQTSKS